MKALFSRPCGTVILGMRIPASELAVVFSKFLRDFLQSRCWFSTTGTPRAQKSDGFAFGGSSRKQHCILQRSGFDHLIGLIVSGQFGAQPKVGAAIEQQLGNG